MSNPSPRSPRSSPAPGAGAWQLPAHRGPGHPHHPPHRCGRDGRGAGRPARLDHTGDLTTGPPRRSRPEQEGTARLSSNARNEAPTLYLRRRESDVRRPVMVGQGQARRGGSGSPERRPRWGAGGDVRMVCHAAAFAGWMKGATSKDCRVDCRSRKAAVDRSAAKAAWPSLLRYRSVPVVPSGFVQGSGTLTSGTSQPGNLSTSSLWASPTSGSGGQTTWCDAGRTGDPSHSSPEGGEAGAEPVSCAGAGRAGGVTTPP